MISILRSSFRGDCHFASSVLIILCLGHQFVLRVSEGEHHFIYGFFSITSYWELCVSQLQYTFLHKFRNMYASPFILVAYYLNLRLQSYYGIFLALLCLHVRNSRRRI